MYSSIVIKADEVTIQYLNMLGAGGGGMDADDARTILPQLQPAQTDKHDEWVIAAAKEAAFADLVSRLAAICDQTGTAVVVHYQTDETVWLTCETTEMQVSLTMTIRPGQLTVREVQVEQYPYEVDYGPETVYDRTVSALSKLQGDEYD